MLISNINIMQVILYVQNKVKKRKELKASAQIPQIEMNTLLEYD